MLEYHGWVTLQDEFSETNDERLFVAADRIRQEVANLSAEHREIGMKIMNATHHVWFSGCTNHLSEDINDIFKLLNVIAANAPGSYGLLYIWDDEDAQFSNEFRIWRLVKGKVSQHGDSLLSPCVPTIEEAE